MTKLKGIEVIHTKKGVKYRAEVRVNGQRFRKTFTSPDDALVWKVTISSQREKNKIYGLKIDNGLYFEDLCRMYLDSKSEIRDSSIDTYKITIEKHLIPVIGKKKIKDVDLSSLDSIKSRMIKSKYSPGSVNKVITQINSIVRFGVERGFLERNPFLGYKKLQIDKQNYQYWDKNEIISFLKKVKDHFYFGLFLTFLSTGLRRGEVCGLMWENFTYLDNGRIQIFLKEQLTPQKKRQGLKGHQSRTLTLSLSISEYLKSVKKESGYVFTNKFGESLSPNYVSQLWKQVQREVGVKKVIKLHGARHSYASFLSSSGVSMQVLGKTLGHKDIKVTMIYAHLNQSDLDNVTGSINFIDEVNNV